MSRSEARRSSLGEASSALCRSGGAFIGSILSWAYPLDAADLFLDREGYTVRLARLLEAVLRVERVPVPNVRRYLERASRPLGHQALLDAKGQHLQIGKADRLTSSHLAFSPRRSNQFTAGDDQSPDSSKCAGSNRL